ncbi:MAG TPA: glycogen debranching N-terminal domain-containing protein [Candidatus Eisenbacteria bacterium]|nr:glycogen debranching N-terminal domain-containing protein [Candidatus Eisenbacteria bacterium]
MPTGEGAPSLNPWINVARLAPVPADVVSVVEGTTFVISDPAGDITPSGTQGMFHRDTRFLSRLELRVNGARLEPLAARTLDPYSARFVLRLPWDEPVESPLVAVRSRFVGGGLHEDLDITNYGGTTAELHVELHVDADFADLFEVKLLRSRPRAGAVVTRRVIPEEGLLQLEHRAEGYVRAIEVRVGSRADEVTGAGVGFSVALAPGATWHTCLDVSLRFDGGRSQPEWGRGAFGSRTDTLEERAREWRGRLPLLQSAWDPLNHLYRRGVDDLAALLMEDPDGAGDLVVAAGLPWFMALFGRDAILTALMALPFDRELATGVLRTLARHQGAREDEASEEQPGKILHEMRFGEVATRGGRRVYYGSVDATPLFVILVAEAWRWGLEWSEVEPLLPNVRRALDWMRTFGDPDGDGYVEYAGRTGRGLRNQGWKDHWDAIQFADGRLAEGPIALCEVQAYRYRALLDASDLLRASGDAGESERARGEAADLARRFRRDFWLEPAGFPALALDGQKRQLDAIASNAGHVLWAGILTPEQEAATARRLVAPDLFSGWGVRTLATSNRGYRPVSYTIGSVWPHDTAIAAAGLARAGFADRAALLAGALVQAGPHFAHRLPELFCGFDRAAFGFPVPYPAAGSPQAWAAASMLLLLKVLLGLEPGPGGQLRARPILPREVLPLRLDGVAGAAGPLSLAVDSDGAVRTDLTPAR